MIGRYLLEIHTNLVNIELFDCTYCRFNDIKFGSSYANTHLDDEGIFTLLTKSINLYAVSAGRLLASLPILAWALWFALTHPLSPSLLFLFSLVYFILILIQPHLWLWIVPAALPILDLAPLTGRFYLDEFDLLMALTIIRFLLFPSVPIRSSRRFHFTLFNLFILFYGVAAIHALLPLEAMHSTTFFSYFTQYNALRLIKGPMWVGLIYILVRHNQMLFNKRTLFNGITLGMSLTIAVCLIERLLFTGLLDLSKDYRIAGLFSGMHIGGAYIDSYLVLALPVFIYTLLHRQRTAVWTILIYISVLASVYIIYVTYSRTTYLAAVFCVLPLLWVAYKNQRVIGDNSDTKKSIVLLGLVLLTISLLVFSGGFIQKRVVDVPADMENRYSHWKMVLSLKQKDVFHHLFGMGLGQYPLHYFWSSNSDRRPGVIGIKHAPNSHTVLLSGGSPVYLNQHFEPQKMRVFSLMIKARALTPGSHLVIYLCEKSYLFSADCLVRHIGAIAPGSEWQKVNVSLTLDNSLGKFQGVRDSFVPLSLGLVNTGQHSLLEIESVTLRNSNGKQLIRNHEFSHGTHHWFFTADNHLAWHVENLFIYFWFELGIIGLLIFLALLSQLLLAALGSYKSGQAEDIILFGGVCGLVFIGLFNSPFDFPRILLLFGLYCISILIFESEPYKTT